MAAKQKSKASGSEARTDEVGGAEGSHRRTRSRSSIWRRFSPKSIR